MKKTMERESKFIVGRFISDSGNIGDYAQIIGMERVYKAMNWIPEFDCRLGSMKQTNDAQVILPIACYFAWNNLTYEPITKPSWLLPVFCGIACANMLAVDLWKNIFAGSNGLPILCRDRFSADLLQKAGYNGHFWGCASLLLPKRTSEPKKGKVYSGDLDLVPNIIKHIPDSIKREMIDLESQELTGSHFESLDVNSKATLMYDKMKAKLQLLHDTARLVITSRLHLALPCIAMGIPVIKVSSQREARNQLIDSYSRSYRSSEFSEIDWEPVAPDIEDAKERMLDIACDVMRATCERAEKNAYMESKIIELNRNSFKHLTKYYSSQESYRGYAGLPPHSQKSGGGNLATQEYFKRITKKYPKDADLVFYGAGSNGMHLLQSLLNLVRECKSFTFVDRDPNRQGRTFGGYPVQSPDCLSSYDRESLVIFVTPFGCCGGAAESIAEYLERTFEFREGVHFYLYELLMYSALQECFGLPCIMSKQIRAEKDLGAWEFDQYAFSV